MSYKRIYDNITFSYSLPSKKFHQSYFLEENLRRLASERGVSPEELIDCYVSICIHDIQKKVTQMIYHDCNSNDNYIIDTMDLKEGTE